MSLSSPHEVPVQEQTVQENDDEGKGVAVGSTNVMRHSNYFYNKGPLRERGGTEFVPRKVDFVNNLYDFPNLSLN